MTRLWRGGRADPYLIVVDGKIGGYGGRLERLPQKPADGVFTPLPHVRAAALPMFRELLAVSQATQIEAQTNIPWMLLMLYDCAKNITSESILFQDAFTTGLVCPKRRVPTGHAGRQDLHPSQ